MSFLSRDRCCQLPFMSIMLITAIFNSHGFVVTLPSQHRHSFRTSTRTNTNASGLHQPTISSSWTTCILKSHENNNNSEPPVFVGPVLDNVDDIVAGASLGELGLDICVAPSSVVPGGLGLYGRLSETSEKVTVPELSLLSGYSRLGTFEAKDIGDKTVGFLISSPETAVFYEQQLMSIADALQLAATRITNDETHGYCGLVGHEIQIEEEDSTTIEIKPVNDGFDRYFVPDLVNGGKAALEEEEYSIQNFGQFCNDLAWDYNDPPSSEQEYNTRSNKSNMIQLVWRMELEGTYLKPSWPVSVFSRDITLENRDFMEMGTRYGYNYWQALIDLEDL